MTEEELTCYGQQLTPIVAKWRVPSGKTVEDLVTDAVSALWMNTSRGKEIKNPTNWLVGTARNKRREYARQTWEHADSADLPSAERSPARTSRISAFQFSRSPIWESLSQDQQYTVIQVLMYDRSISDIAKELGVNRSTVKSWVSRIPRRLAKDSYFQSLLRGNVNNG